MMLDNDPTETGPKITTQDSHGEIISVLADIIGDPINYDLRKKEAAKRLWVGVSAIHKAVKKEISNRREAEERDRVSNRSPPF